MRLRLALWLAALGWAPPVLAGDLAQALVAAREGAGTPAMAVMVLDADGMAALHLDGVRSNLGADPVQPGDAWHIGSNAKAMTATLAMLLARDGVLALDEPLSAFFPDLTLHRDLAEVPFAALLTHRSGLAANLTVGQMTAARRSRDTLPEQRAALAAHWLTRRPAQAPGRFEYSNLGYLIAGAALEARTGADWFDLLGTHVLAPLGIASVGIGAPQGAAPEGHRSVFGLMLRPEPATDPGADNPPVLGPAGTLHIAPADYARFLASQLPGGPLLTEAERAVLFDPPDPAAMPPYALGWAQVRLPDGRLVWQHAGSNTLWLTIARLEPARGRAAAVFANAANPATEAGLRALLDTALPPGE